MKALLDAPDSLTRRILEKAGSDADEASRLTMRFIERQTRVAGTPTQARAARLAPLCARSPD